LLERARRAERCHIDNTNQPREPGLSESERADTQGFLRELLRILPLLAVSGSLKSPRPLPFPEPSLRCPGDPRIRETQ
jgi:hypothetical protein